MRFENKCVLITGGGSGIGQASALAFAKEGGIVGVADIDADTAGRTVEVGYRKRRWPGPCLYARYDRP